MTVKELLLSVGFDNVIGALRKTHRNDQSIDNVAGYKEAFDEICLTDFAGEGGEVTFDVTPQEEWEDPESLPMLARNVEGDYWSNIVGKTVITPDNNPFTDAELAGAILWGMTFYGFTRNTKWIPYDEILTFFGERAERLERKLYLPYIRDKREKRKLKSKERIRFGIGFTKEVWKQIRYRQIHQNRAKRKRYYRLKKRIAELKRLDKRLYLINTIHEKCGFYDRQLESRIMTTGSLHLTWRDSHVADMTSRADYLAGLLTKYSPTINDMYSYQSCEELIIVAYTSETSPLTSEEENYIKKVITRPNGNNPIKTIFIKGIDNEAKEDIFLQFIVLSPNIMTDDEND